MRISTAIQNSPRSLRISISFEIPIDLKKFIFYLFIERNLGSRENLMALNIWRKKGLKM